jgi:hypothetical protein
MSKLHIMELVERREIQFYSTSFNVMCDIQYMAVDSNLRAVAFSMYGTVDVYVLHDGKLAAHPSFSLIEEEPALCYFGGTVPDDADNDGVNMTVFDCVAVQDQYLAFYDHNGLHIWNWKTKEALLNRQCVWFPSGMTIKNGMLHLQYRKMTVLVSLDTYAEQLIHLPVSEFCRTDLRINPHDIEDIRDKPRMQSRYIFEERMMDDMRCVLEYDMSDKSLYFCTYDAQTMAPLLLPYKLITCRKPQYIVLQWRLAGAYIFLYTVDESKQAEPVLFVFHRKPWDKPVATAFMNCLQRCNMPIELSSYVGSFLLAMK